MKSAEQRARDMLERMGVENAQGFPAGDLVELANLIAVRDEFATDAARYRGLRKLALDGGNLEARVAVAQLDYLVSADAFDAEVDEMIKL